MKRFNKTIYLNFLMIILMFSFASEWVKADGVKLPSTSYTTMPGLAAKYGAPESVEEILGIDGNPSNPYRHFFNNRFKIYPNRSLTGLIWGKDMPFYLRDKATGKLYPGYCAQSWVTASKSMQIKGVVTDSRVLKLVSTIANTNAESPTTAQQIAIQTVLWGALNESWRADMFSGNHVASSTSAYTHMEAPLDHILRVKANWADIISDKKPIKRIEVNATHIQALHHPNPDIKTALVTVPLTSEGGGTPPEAITEIASFGLYAKGGGNVPSGWTYLDRATPGIPTKIVGYGVDLKSNNLYYEIPIPEGTEEQSHEVQLNIAYKNRYAVLNNLTLLVYKGGENNQPFLLPKQPSPVDDFVIKVKPILPTPPSCLPTDPYYPTCEPPTPPSCPETHPHFATGCVAPPPDPSGSVKRTPLRWHSMPSAYAEIKDGVGHNNNGATSTGGFASTRNLENFEAMNGVPSTERLYVNLGGSEGYIDVSYDYVEVDQELSTTWSSSYYDSWSCGDSTCSCGGTDDYSTTFNWKMKFLHLKEATMRVFNNGTLSQDDLKLDIEIVNAVAQPATFNLNGNTAARDVGPGNGSAKYNYGAENQWKTIHNGQNYGTHSKCSTTESDDRSKAHDAANSAMGDIFAQNDSLLITIQGTTYTIVPSMNKKASKPFSGGSSGGGVLDATNGTGLDYFVPRKDKWDVWSHIPFNGYNGNPHLQEHRNSPGTKGNRNPIILENIPIPHNLANGVYHFELTEDGNTLDYETLVTTIKGATSDLKEDVSLLDDGVKKGTQSQYIAALNPKNKEHYLSGNKVQLQYTNWQVPVSSGAHDMTFANSMKEPDGKADKALNDIPRYRSANPIVIHNPVSVQFAWVGDVPKTELQDQRIVANSNTINQHPSVNNEAHNARLYIDYDFQLTIPNNATFNKYWGQKAELSNSAGQTDIDFTSPGTLGKYFMDTKTISKYGEREPVNPYQQQTSGSNYYLTTDGNNINAITSRNTWDVAKWTTAKYVKFPFDVYYYKNSGESGGDPQGWYDRGEWIKLYDDMFSASKTADPSVFNFHVGSNTKDINDGIIYVMSEAINSQDSTNGDAVSLYASAEQYTNGERNPEGTSIGNHTNGRDAEAAYSAVNQINIDVLGRIGNLAVTDATDPAWADVFWTTQNGKINVNSPVHKFYGLNYNIFENGLYPNNTGFAAYDRYKTLSEWLGANRPTYTLPVRTNPVSKGQQEQALKLGYTIGGSIQTIGDYDDTAGSSLYIYPQNQLVGNYQNGNPSTPFKLITSDPYNPGSKYMEYYDSKVNNTLHGNTAVNGLGYTPAYKHNISSTLADPRMKLSAWEKDNEGYQKAAQLGSNSKVLLGTPSFIKIPLSMRTEIGSHETQGRYGNIYIYPPHRNGNNASGAKGSGSGSASSGASLINGSCYCEESYENIQKWNWNYSLPQNTRVWFDNKKRADGTPILEEPNKDQYVITSMTFRTKAVRDTVYGEMDDTQMDLEVPAIHNGDNYLVKEGQSLPDWDLTMYTSNGVVTGANGTAPVPRITTIAGQDPTIGSKYPSGITPSTSDPGGSPVTSKDKWDPKQEGDISRPSLDIVWWNYSKQSTTDKETIGTH